MNICFFSGDVTRSGGTENVAITIANELNKNEEYNVSFVSLTERKKETFFNIDKSIPRHILYQKESEGLIHYIGHIIRLRRIVKKYDIDIIVDIDGIIDMYSVPTKWLTHVKVVSWEHFNYYHHPTPKLRNKVRKHFAKHLDAIITLTQQDKENYERELDLKCPVIAIHNPIEQKKPSNNYNIDSKIIISVGRLTYQKGFDRLVDIADKLLHKYDDWEWHIYGEGEDRLILNKAIEEKRLVDKLKLMGNVSDIDQRYKNASIFAMTSRFEGLPMTLLEAKYYKLPIISYDIETGPRDCIIDGVNGYLVKENDEKTFVNRINELIDNPEKRKRFSARSTEDTDKFKLNRIIKQWDELFEQLK